MKPTALSRARTEATMLKEQVARLEDDKRAKDVVINAALKERDTAKTKAKEAMDAVIDMADLKIRLAAAELQCEYMRGYLARVREGDVLASPPVFVGDPSGEQELVPKHPKTEFPRPDHFTYPSRGEMDTDAFYNNSIRDSERRKKARHWVNYRP